MGIFDLYLFVIIIRNNTAAWNVLAFRYVSFDRDDLRQHFGRCDMPGRQAARLSAQMLQTRRANVKFFTEMQQCFCFRFAVFRMAPARAASFVFKYI